MSEPSGSTVDCPVCETAFDPTAAGGWCTNPDCGEWRYEDADGSATTDEEQQTTEPTGEPAIDSDDADSGGRGDMAVSDVIQPARTEPKSTDPDLVDAKQTTPEPTESDSSDPQPEPAEESGEAQTETDTAAEARAEGQKPELERAGDTATGDEQPGGEQTGDEQPGEEGQEHEQDDTAEAPEPAIECPECDTGLEADVNFCPECGTDVSALPNADDQPACPDCGEDVDPGDNFCAACGADLTEPEPLTACPGCGVDVEAGDSYCVECGEHLDPHRPGGDASAGGSEAATGTSGSAGASGFDTVPSQAAPAALMLTTRGRELTVSDGDTVGRRVRRIVAETDGDEEEAVRIHREHVRFVRESGQFHLVDLGDNPTRLNDQPLQKGDRQPIEPGDELELSGVVTLSVERP